MIAQPGVGPPGDGEAGMQEPYPLLLQENRANLENQERRRKPSAAIDTLESSVRQHQQRKRFGFGNSIGFVAM